MISTQFSFSLYNGSEAAVEKCCEKEVFWKLKKAIASDLKS